MRRTCSICILVLGLVLRWSMVCAEDFYVIPIMRAYAPVEKTGQTGCWNSSGASISCNGTGQDGEYQKGVPWPTPRFTDNGNGTVTDNLTRLIWTKNANYFGTRDWDTALSDCNALASGSRGLTDGSVAGEWRLPNLRELQSLVHYGVWGPSLPNTQGTAKWAANDSFTNVQSNAYWSSTTHEASTIGAWFVHFSYGYVNGSDKVIPSYVWCVRGGPDIL